jgi:hypothetical protein
MSNNRKVRFGRKNSYHMASGVHHDYDDEIKNPPPNEGEADRTQEMDLEKMYAENLSGYPTQYLEETQTAANTLANNPKKWGVGEFNDIDPEGNPRLNPLPRPNYPPLIYPPVTYAPLPPIPPLPSNYRLPPRPTNPPPYAPNTLEMDPYKWGVGEFNDIDAQGNPKGGKSKVSRKHRINSKRKRTQRKATNKRKIKTRKANSRR